jgi:branched-chain amino acid transport system permease protein
MAYFLQLVFAGMALGCVYALIGLGFAIIFKASHVINFAQGEILLVGAYIISAGVFEWRIGFFPALVLALVLTVLIALIFERFVLRRMIGRPPFSILMITIGLDIVLRTLVIARWGSNPVAPGAPFDLTSGLDFKNILDGNIHLGANDLWTIGVTILLCLALYYFFNRTSYGLAMRAAALDQEAALAMGIDVRRVNMLAWGISAAVATIGGAFLATRSVAIDPLLGATALLAFPAIILGGATSINGAIVGGIIIGLAEVLTAGYENALFAGAGRGLSEITPYLIMVLVLLIRPYGLFGRREVERI